MRLKKTAEIVAVLATLAATPGRGQTAAPEHAGPAVGGSVPSGDAAGRTTSGDEDDGGDLGDQDLQSVPSRDTDGAGDTAAHGATRAVPRTVRKPGVVPAAGKEAGGAAVHGTSGAAAPVSPASHGATGAENGAAPASAAAPHGAAPAAALTRGAAPAAATPAGAKTAVSATPVSTEPAAAATKEAPANADDADSDDADSDDAGAAATRPPFPIDTTPTPPPAAALPPPPSAEATGTATYGSLKFDETAFDFGDVYRGTELTHRFRFVNSGPGPLTVQGVHAACGCTAAEVEKGRKYQPGESGFVDVKLDTTDFAGDLVKTVTVMSNEKLLPDRTLTLKAFVKTEIEADPPLVDFGDVHSQTGGTRVIRIKSIGGTHQDVKDVAFNREVFDTTWAKDKDDWVVTVKLHAGLPPGFLKEQLVIRNTSEHLRELPVPVRANILGNIDVSPTYLEFGAIAPSESVTRSVTMRGTVDFDVVGTRAELIVNGRRIDDAAKYIKVNTLPHEKDRRLVSVELRNGSNVAGSVHGKLYFQTTDASQKELPVDFYAFFR